MPLGIFGALVISCVLYLAMAAVLTGMVPYTTAQRGRAASRSAIDLHPEQHVRLGHAS